MDRDFICLRWPRRWRPVRANGPRSPKASCYFAWTETLRPCATFSAKLDEAPRVKRLFRTSRPRSHCPRCQSGVRGLQCDTRPRHPVTGPHGRRYSRLVSMFFYADIDCGRCRCLRASSYFLVGNYYSLDNLGPERPHQPPDAEIPPSCLMPEMPISSQTLVYTCLRHEAQM